MRAVKLTGDEAPRPKTEWKVLVPRPKQTPVKLVARPERIVQQHPPLHHPSAGTLERRPKQNPVELVARTKPVPLALEPHRRQGPLEGQPPSQHTPLHQPSAGILERRPKQTPVGWMVGPKSVQMAQELYPRQGRPELDGSRKRLPSTPMTSDRDKRHNGSSPVASDRMLGAGAPSVPALATPVKTISGRKIYWDGH